MTQKVNSVRQRPCLSLSRHLEASQTMKRTCQSRRFWRKHEWCWQSCQSHLKIFKLQYWSWRQRFSLKNNRNWQWVLSLLIHRLLQLCSKFKSKQIYNYSKHCSNRWPLLVWLSAKTKQKFNEFEHMLIQNSNLKIRAWTIPFHLKSFILFLLACLSKFASF